MQLLFELLEHCLTAVTKSRALLALLLKTGDNFFPKELAVHVGKLAFLPLLPEGEQRHGLLEVTCLPLQVELGVVISLPTNSMETSLHN